MEERLDIGGDCLVERRAASANRPRMSHTSAARTQADDRLVVAARRRERERRAQVVLLALLHRHPHPLRLHRREDPVPGGLGDAR